MNGLPGDLSLIINKFTHDRPLKNRGINIDIFVTKTPFENLITDFNTKFSIGKTIASADESVSLDKETKLHFLNYNPDFLYGYSLTDSFILEFKGQNFCFISNFRRKHHDKVVGNLSMMIYPHATKAFLSTRQMYDIISKANSEGKYDLRVRSDYIFGKSGFKKRSMEYHTDVISELPTVEKTFKEKQLDRANISMCKLISAQTDNPLAITLSGNGHIGIYEGSFDAIFSLFVEPIMELSLSRIENFSHRSMSETVDRKPRPVIIEFTSNPFTEVKAIKDLIGLIDKYPHCNYSLVHSGNPHLYLYLQDRIDYSSFSIRTLDANKIIVSPQIKTSPESMARFINHLLTGLKDGEITAEA